MHISDSKCVEITCQHHVHSVKARSVSSFKTNQSIPSEVGGDGGGAWHLHSVQTRYPDLKPDIFIFSQFLLLLYHTAGSRSI